LKLVLSLVEPATQLAHLVFKRIDAGKKLGQQIVATILLLGWRGIRRCAAARAPAARRLVLDRLQLLPELINLILQGDAFAALDLGVTRRRRGKNKRRHDERSNDEPHRTSPKNINPPI
jgi:hypothetical protein